MRNAAHELDDQRAATEAELTTAIQSGRSLKTIGAKQQVLADKSYFVPVEWDHSGIEAGKRRLARAVEAVEKFPKPSEAARRTTGQAKLLLELRTLILEKQHSELGKALEAISDHSHQRLDEVGMAWQEFLTYELERATKPPTDQAALKVALKRATAVGMAPMEKPVYKALAVFFDPPEFVGDLYADEVWPSADGSLTLRVRVRGYKTLHWVKNDIALKENADGGRVKGVDGPELTFTHLLGRDRGQKVWCIAENKWGKVESHKVILRLDGEGDRRGARQQAVSVANASGTYPALDGTAEGGEVADATAPHSLPLFNRSKSGAGITSERVEDDDEDMAPPMERQSTFQEASKLMSGSL